VNSSSSAFQCPPRGQAKIRHSYLNCFPLELTLAIFEVLFISMPFQSPPSGSETILHFNLDCFYFKFTLVILAVPHAPNLTLK